MEADDRQVMTVLTVQPSFHHRHSTEYHNALPSSANVQLHFTSSFADDGNMQSHLPLFADDGNVQSHLTLFADDGNVQSHLTLSFADDVNASWYSVCRVRMVEWRLDCENCHHLTVSMMLPPE